MMPFIGKNSQVHNDNAMRSINGKREYVQKLLAAQKEKQAKKDKK
jgi:hypothetical protein